MQLRLFLNACANLRQSRSRASSRCWQWTVVLDRGTSPELPVGRATNAIAGSLAGKITVEPTKQKTAAVVGTSALATQITYTRAAIRRTLIASKGANFHSEANL